ncbi:hypothetical protein PCE1_004276 [Barthelona sp. PCE]
MRFIRSTTEGIQMLNFSGNQFEVDPSFQTIPTSLTQPVSDVSISADKSIAGIATNTHFRLINIETNTLILEEALKSVVGCVFSPDSRFCAMFQRLSPRLMRERARKTNKKSKYLVVENNFRFYNCENGEEVFRTTLDAAIVNDKWPIFFFNDTNHLFVFANTCLIFDFECNQLIEPFGKLRFMKQSQCDKNLFIMCTANMVKLVRFDPDLLTFIILQTFEVQKFDDIAVQFVPDRAFCLIHTNDTNDRFYHGANILVVMDETKSTRLKFDNVHSFDIHKSNKLMAVVSGNPRTLYVYNIETRFNCIADDEVDGNHVAFSPNGQFLTVTATKGSGANTVVYSVDDALDCIRGWRRFYVEDACSFKWTTDSQYMMWTVYYPRMKEGNCVFVYSCLTGERVLKDTFSNLFSIREINSDAVDVKYELDDRARSMNMQVVSATTFTAQVSVTQSTTVTKKPVARIPGLSAAQQQSQSKLEVQPQNVSPQPPVELGLPDYVFEMMGVAEPSVKKEMKSLLKKIKNAEKALRRPVADRRPIQLKFIAEKPANIDRIINLARDVHLAREDSK